SQRCIPEFF
nr:Chain B, F-box DNA helicase 1 [Homo sapiens]8F5Q_D Chain D, F-box DNA helicase 1 [Homo sapiens]8F5Q_F Chain F, F-box DNA helicase 1 [Homo sapiens]